jgi:hypothetical protein
VDFFGWFCEFSLFSRSLRCSMDDEAAVPRDGEDEVTPRLSDTQSFSVDGTEMVTQEFMVRDQLEQERIRMEKKVSANTEKIELHRLRKSWLV